MKTGRRNMLGLALLGSVASALGAAPASPVATLDEELAAIAADKTCELASLSVLAIRNGKVAYQQQFGQRFLAANGRPSKPANSQTLFRIASVSKMMTTLAAMRLVEEGKLSLDTDVGEFLGFPLRNPHFPDKAITLRHILSHTASLRDAAGYSFPATVTLQSFLTPGQAQYGQGAMWASIAEPGAYFTYSNLGWGVIGTLMEKVTGERFDRLMKRLLLDPLGMRGGFHPAAFPADDLANLATLYRKRTTDTDIWNAAGPWIAQVDDYSVNAPASPAGIENAVIGTNATPFSPTGGLRVSAEGMGKVMLMLMNGGMHEGRRILKPATLKLMLTRQWSADATGSNGDTHHGLFQHWGLGNQHFPDRDGTRLVEGGGFDAIGHLGEAYGLMSVFALDLAAKNAMVVLAGGVSSDPEVYKGIYSSLSRFEEKILTALHRHVTR